MPGTHGGTHPVQVIYKNAREEGIKVQNFRKEQREHVGNAQRQEEKLLLEKVREARHSSDARWASTLENNPLKRNLLKDIRRAEAHNARTETVLEQDQAGKSDKSHDVYMASVRSMLSDRAASEQDEDELAELRMERRRLLERKKQIKAALGLRRRVFTGKVSRSCKGLLQVSIENGYGRAPGSGPPTETRLTLKNGPLSKSSPTLGSGVTAELHATAFPAKEKKATSPPPSPGQEWQERRRSRTESKRQYRDSEAQYVKLSAKEEEMSRPLSPGQAPSIQAPMSDWARHVKLSAKEEELSQPLSPGQARSIQAPMSSWAQTVKLY